MSAYMLPKISWVGKYIGHHITFCNRNTGAMYSGVRVRATPCRFCGEATVTSPLMHAPTRALTPIAGVCAPHA
jgi:hypothetical protein